MKNKALKICVFLLTVATSLHAITLSELIRNSQYCVIGEFTEFGTISHTFTIDSCINSSLSYDSIKILKRGSSLYPSLHNMQCCNGQKYILFVNNPIRYQTGNGYFEYEPEGMFQILQDSVVYKEYKMSVNKFIQLIYEYSTLHDSFCATFQRGEQTSTEIETFKKESSLHAKLIDETYEYCYSDNSKMDNTTPVVSATKMNVLYIGPQNPVCIAVPKYAPDNVYATIANGEILKDGSCYKVKVFKPGRTQICVYEKKSNKLLGCSEFRVRIVPDPVVMFMGMQGGYVKKRMVMASRSIDAKIVNMDFDFSLPIAFYTVTIACDTDTVSFQGTGRRFTPEIIEAFQNIQAGAKIYFENVVVYDENLGERTLGTALFKVED